MMAAGAGLQQTLLAPSATSTRHVAIQPFHSASISVGADDWANQVINNVVGGTKPPLPDKDTAAAAKRRKKDQVNSLIGEKLKLFHGDRLLELKNLPDGVTEQVSHVVIHKKYTNSYRSHPKIQLKNSAKPILSTGFVFPPIIFA